MEENLTYIDDLIIRHLAGETDKDEDSMLHSWIKEDSKNEKYFNRSRELWFSSMTENSLKQYDWRKAFDAFISWRNRKQDRQARRKRLFTILRNVSAACLLATAVSYVSFRIGKTGLTENLASITVEAPAGSNVRTVLPDGTTVMLNSCSYITYSQAFGLKDRTVKLCGEGYFDIKKNEKLPFIIETGNIIVEDIGTKFNISDYNSDEKAVLKLDEGKVSMQGRKGDGKKYYLVPNQKAVFDKSSGRMTVTDIMKNNSNGWTEGKIILNGEPLITVKNMLERAYGVRITISNSELYRCNFHGEFDREEQSVDYVLETLSMTGKIKYRKNGRNITIY